MTNRPGSNDRQKPSRRVQMANAAAYTVQVLEEAAAGDVDPDRLRLAAAGLTAAVHRFTEPKPPRQPRRRPLPRPGDATRYVRDRTSPELDAAAARIVNDAIARLRERATP